MEGFCRGITTQQYIWNVCAVHAALIPVHCLPLGKPGQRWKTERGGPGIQGLPCSYCVWEVQRTWDTPGRPYQNTTGETIVSGPSYTLILLPGTCSCRYERRDGFLDGKWETQRLIHVCNSPFVIFSSNSLSTYFLYPPVLLWAQMDLWLRLLGSLFQGCGQLLHGFMGARSWTSPLGMKRTWLERPHQYKHISLCREVELTSAGLKLYSFHSFQWLSCCIM